MLIEPGKEKDALEMTDTAASMNLYEEAKRAMEVLSQAMNSVYIYRNLTI